MNKLTVNLAVVCSLMALGGCRTEPIQFKQSSAPVPPEGYTIIGKPVSGTSTQYYVFCIGGDVSSSQQFNAFEDAMSKADNADALVNMTIDQHRYSPLYIGLLYEAETMRVTGTPVKFNKK